MQSKSKSCLILFLTCILFQYSLAYEKQKDGVFFELTKQKNTDVRWMKIQVCADNIIRVIASPVDSFSTRPSLMVEKTEWEKTPFTVKESGAWVEIATGRETRPRSS